MKYSFEKFLSLLAKYYVEEDAAHDAGHARRIYLKAKKFARKYSANKDILALGTALHGVVEKHGKKAGKTLEKNGVPAKLISSGIEAAFESLVNSKPKTLEGKILHDAHLCEGGRAFIAVKALVKLPGPKARASRCL